METLEASEIFSALGHETRLAVFRILVEAGDEGLSAGIISERVGIAAPTLSFHLGHLSRVGLIRGRQDGRYIYYAADFPLVDDLLAFMIRNCCQGTQCLPKTAALNAACCAQGAQAGAGALHSIDEPAA